MGTTVSTGPAVSAGPLLGYPARAPDNNPLAGPSVTYQGDAVPDPRFGILGGNERAGSIRAHSDIPYFLMTDAVPAASAATPVNIAPAAAVVAGAPMVLAGPSAGVATSIPFIPLSLAFDLGAPVYGDGVPTLAGVTLDYGLASLALNVGSVLATLTAAAASQNLLYQGQWLVIAGAGNAAGTLPLIAQIVAISPNGLTLTLSVPSAFTGSQPFGQGNILDPMSVAPSTGWIPRLMAGIVAMFNPLDAVSRGVGIACSAAGGGGGFLVKGWDVYGMPMSELVTHPGGAVVQYGRKAFKHIGSVTPQFTDAGRTYSVGTSDLFGFHLRSDKVEYANIYFSGAINGTSAGYTPADVTSPATPTTGDVRGTLQIGNRGPLGAGNGYGTTAIAGNQRIAFFTSMPLVNLIGATPANPAPLYGVTQA